MENLPLLPEKHYRESRHEIRSGDLLLCSGSSVFSSLIQKATQSEWSHVAFILRLDVINRIMVLESVESIGVRVVPLSTYISDYNATRKGYPGQLLLARHQGIKQENMTKLSTFAVDLLGFPYGKDEIIRIAARIGMHAAGVPSLKPLALPQHEFICSEYAYACFKSIGIDFNFNEAGFIAPADFIRHPEVNPLYYLRTETESSSCAPLHGALNAPTHSPL